jgi:hypothetical protein
LTPSPAVRRALLAVVLVLLLWLAWTGLSGGYNQISQSQTLGQKIQTFSQGAYGLLASMCVVTTFFGRKWGRAVQTGWVVSVTAAAGLASVVWGGTGVGIGVLSAGAALIIAVAIVWLLRVGARGLSG